MPRDKQAPSSAGVRHAAAVALAAVLFLGAACARAPEPPAPGGEDAALHRLVALLDYIGSDYAGAVHDGHVVSQVELDEQVSFAESAGKMARDLGPRAPARLLSELAELEAACRAAAPPDRVAELSRSARRQVVDAFGLVQSPDTPPSRASGTALYAKNCAPCHGVDGHPPEEKLRELTPPPRTLAERDVLAPLSPYRVFNAITFGVEGTAMASFDSLPAAQRWDLAFHALTLRAPAHPDAGAIPRGFRPSLAALATSTDDDLRQRLGLGDAHATEAALDALRTEVPYSEAAASAPLAVARRGLDQALAAARAGRRDEASARLLDAYFAGFERAEGPLRASDAALVTAVEAEFLRLRGAVAEGDERVTTASAAALRRLLGRAELRLEAAPRGPWFGAIAGLVIIVREGAETALLVLLLLASVAGMGREDARRTIHAGWTCALALGLVTFGVAHAISSRLALQSELVEGVATLAAAVVLFYVSHWMVGQAQAARWAKFLRERVRSNITQGRLLALFALAFLAVYREAFETVLFLEGLLAGNPNSAYVLGGALAGGLVLAATVILLRRLGTRLPLRAFFTVSSIVLYALCVVFAGKGVRALIAAGVLPAHPLPLPSLPALGVHADAATLIAQVVLILAVAASLLVNRRRAPQQA